MGRYESLPFADSRLLTVLMKKLGSRQYIARLWRHFIYFLAEVDWELMLQKK